MGFETEIEKKGGYIHFRLKGVFKGFEIDKEIIDVFYKIEESSKRYDCLKVLLDATELDYEIDNTERYKIGEYVANIYRKNLIRIACLRCSNMKDDFKGAIFKFFNDENEAVKWLKD